MSLVRYGVIWISAGLATGAGLWYTRGPGMMGVDVAALVEGVTERGLAGYNGANDYAFTSNVVTAAVLWSPLYETAMCGARTAALTAISSNAWWVTGDGPEDAQDATLTADAPAPWTSLDSRVKTTNTAYYGLSYTNVPLSAYLWSRTNTNAPAPYASGAVPWPDNWWTAAGLGTNIYRYACERAQPNTYTTNYFYTLTGHTGAIPSHTNKFQVGAVYSYAGDSVIGPYSAKAYVPDAPAVSYTLYALTVGSTKLWALGPNIYSYWQSTSPTWPDIGSLVYSGDTLAFTKNMTVTTNWPVRVNKGIVITNLNECRVVLTNLNRTVWFGWNASEITATNLIQYNDYTAFYSDPGTWPQGETTSGVCYGLYAAGLSSWRTATSTNTATEAGATLAGRTYSPYADFWNNVYPHTSAGMQYYDVAQLYVYGGCQAPLYPSDYAFRSNFVARLRVYVLVKDEFAELPRRWYRVCDESSPTTRPFFELGSPQLKPSGSGWDVFRLASDDFSIYDEGGWMRSHAEFGLEGNVGGDLQLEGYAVVVDWKWMGL